MKKFKEMLITACIVLGAAAAIVSAVVAVIMLP
jgi:uncharacterized membrane protein YphA (DoxX/SURF4 family)